MSALDAWLSEKSLTRQVRAWRLPAHWCVTLLETDASGVMRGVSTGYSRRGRADAELEALKQLRPQPRNGGMTNGQVEEDRA